MLLTNRQTNKQTNKNRQKHYLLGGGNNRLSHYLVDNKQLKDSLTHLSTSIKQQTPDAELVRKSIR